MNPPLSPTGITGESLAQGEVCLTFDDGPDARTSELGEYLAAHRVTATFFVVGKHVVQHPDVVPRLRQLGHEVGNHTFHHANLQDLLAGGSDITAEMTSAVSTISTAGPIVVPFRPPYGAWSPRVAEALNRHVFAAARHVGPVLWDVDGRDWAAWGSQVDPVTCAQEYLRRVEVSGRGIVLMHDSAADSEVLRGRNRTYEMVQLLVPWLLERGYRFVSLGDVKEVAAAREAGVAFRVVAPHLPSMEARMVSHHEAVLRTDDGRFVVAEDGGGGRGLLTTDRADPDGRFEVLPLSNDRAAFRSRAGHFLTGQPTKGAFDVTSSGLTQSTSFPCRPVMPSLALSEPTPERRGDHGELP